MNVPQHLRMNSGEGKQSYANNSLPQWSLMARTRPYIQEAMLKVFSSMKPRTLNIADLGCSSGPTALLAVDMILDVVNESCPQQHVDPCPELHAFLNDLHGNDFNAVFKATPSFYQKLRDGKGWPVSCFVSATPGSFHGRLFPRQSLHFVYSANSLHWLSQVPPLLTRKEDNPNKGNIGLGKTSPPIVLHAYSAQFRADFTDFLKSRSEEIVPGGCMVLSLKGRNTLDHTSEERDPLWPTFATAFEDMIRKGAVEEERVDSFNMPFHEAHVEELREIVRDEGSFDIAVLEAIPYAGQNFGSNYMNRDLLANFVRAFTEPLLAAHFGEGLMDELFDKYKEKIPVTHTNKAEVAVVASLVRKI